MKNIQKWLFLAAFVFVIFGCQKDDICPPGTETTPLLIIDFLDNDDPTRLKAVRNLVVKADGMEMNYLGPTTTNSISIPLRTNENFTEYSFIFNSGTDTENEDVVTFSYTPSLEYLNRACGYKVDFENLDVTVHGDGEKWILSNVILQQNVENATEAHLTFFH